MGGCSRTQHPVSEAKAASGIRSETCRAYVHVDSGPASLPARVPQRTPDATAEMLAGVSQVGPQIRRGAAQLFSDGRGPTCRG